jgi:hypothetical protein
VRGLAVSKAEVELFVISGDIVFTHKEPPVVLGIPNAHFCLPKGYICLPKMSLCQSKNIFCLLKNLLSQLKAFFYLISLLAVKTAEPPALNASHPYYCHNKRILGCHR